MVLSTLPLQGPSLSSLKTSPITGRTSLASNLKPSRKSNLYNFHTYVYKPATNVRPSYRENKPFIYKDSKTQVRAVFHTGYIHADDWMYFMWTEACPNDESPVIATLADAWSPGFIGYEFDRWEATAYVDFAREDQMPYHYL